MASEGWLCVVEHWEEQCSVNATNIMQTPLETHDLTLAQEYKKGLVMGLRFCIQFPPSLIADSEIVIEAFREKPKEEEAT